MQFLPGERIISEIADRSVRLTSHRIRHQTRTSGNDRVVTFMLDEVASCGLVGESSPWLLLAAAICGVAALVEQGEVRIGLLIGAALFVGAYFATRRHVGAGDGIH